MLDRRVGLGLLRTYLKVVFVETYVLGQIEASVARNLWLPLGMLLVTHFLN